MAGIAALRRIQIAEETNTGEKPINADELLLGKLTMEKEVKLHRPEDERGSLAPNHRSIVTGESVALSFEGDVSLEQIIHILNMAVTGNPETSGTQAPFTWTYYPDLANGNVENLKTYTFEYGDNEQKYRAEYVGCSELEISGALDEPLKVKATLFGRNQVEGTFSNIAAAPTTLTTALTNKTLLYIDGAEISNTMIEFTWKLETGFASRKHGGDGLFYDSIGEKPKKVILEMTLEFNEDSKGEWSDYIAGNSKRFKLVSDNSPSDQYQFSLEMAGVYTKFSSLEENEGADTVKVSIEGECDSTWDSGKLFEVIVINSVAP